MLSYYKRSAQSAADGGALGAAQDLYRGGTSATGTLAAQRDITSNGFTDGVNGAHVTVNIPPSSGPHLGGSTYAEVYVSKTVPTSFKPYIPSNTITLTSTSAYTMLQ